MLQDLRLLQCRQSYRLHYLDVVLIHGATQMANTVPEPCTFKSHNKMTIWRAGVVAPSLIASVGMQSSKES
jgi:hypothetical protein